MALSQKQKEDLLKFGMIIVGGVLGYKIFFEKIEPVKAVKETIIDVPVETVTQVAKTTKKQVYKLKNYIGI
jgi:hypothetical protein